MSDDRSQREFPRYELLAPFYAPNDTLFPEGFELEFDGTPNEFMRPLNAEARKKMAEYMPSVDKRSLDVQLQTARDAEKGKPVPVIAAPITSYDRSAPYMPDPLRHPKPSAALVGEAKAPEADNPKRRGRPKKMFGSVIQETGGDANSRGGY